MAASKVAISLVINSSLHVLSEGKILSPGLRNQIDMAIEDLRELLTTSKLPESGTDNDQQSSDHGSGLLDRARDAVDIADKFLLQASLHLMSHQGCLTKIRALVHFMLLRISARAIEKMALDFITSVKDLSAHLSQMKDLPPCGLHNLDKNSSSWNAHQGNVHWNGMVELNIVGREDEERELLARLTVQDDDQDMLRLLIVSAVGEEAIGKTALARSVYNRLDIDHSFHCHVWVHVPEEFAMKSGSRVIVTTRDPEIPSLMDPGASPLKLNELDADQSKRLLGECGSVAEDPGLTARILSKCSGSPPRILLLGVLAVASDHSSCHGGPAR